MFSVVFGILLLAAPITGAVVLAYWLGGYALAFGMMLVALGLHLTRADRTPLVTGAITPAVAFGPTLSPHLLTPELSLSVG